jgi:hypothetical protein
LKSESTPTPARLDPDLGKFTPEVNDPGGKLGIIGIAILDQSLLDLRLGCLLLESLLDLMPGRSALEDARGGKQEEHREQHREADGDNVEPAPLLSSLPYDDKEADKKDDQQTEDCKFHGRSSSTVGDENAEKDRSRMAADEGNLIGINHERRAENP